MTLEGRIKRLEIAVHTGFTCMFANILEPDKEVLEKSLALFVETMQSIQKDIAQ